MREFNMIHKLFNIDNLKNDVILRLRDQLQNGMSNIEMDKQLNLFELNDKEFEV